MTAARFAVLTGGGVLILLFVRLGSDFVAHVARYRRYRRLYPAADRGRTWKYVR